MRDGLAFYGARAPRVGPGTSEPRSTLVPAGPSNPRRKPVKVSPTELAKPRLACSSAVPSAPFPQTGERQCKQRNRTSPPAPFSAFWLAAIVLCAAFWAAVIRLVVG